MENVTPKAELPNATGILVLGILSIVMCGIFGLIMGIISLTMSSKTNALYVENPELYSLSSYKNMKAGRTCAIIGTSLSGVAMLFLILYLIFIGSILTAVFSHIGTCA